MKIKLNTDDNLPLSNPLKLHLLAMVVRSLLEDDNDFYLELYLEDFLYELCV